MKSYHREGLVLSKLYLTILASDPAFQARDFLLYSQDTNTNSVFFTSKATMIKALRDSNIQKKYPELIISKNTLRKI